MILAPDSTDERFPSRVGDALDTALVEVVRTLDAAGDEFDVLAPWTEDLAPLVLAATIDTTPAFDPEDLGGSRETRSRIVPYRLPGRSAPGAESPFWRASGLSLTREAAIPLASALAEHQPNILLVLGLPADARNLLGGLDMWKVKVLTFGSLASQLEIAERLGISSDRVYDLELALPETKEPEVERLSESALERSAEADLEAYVPYGLLLQVTLDEFLPGDEREGGSSAR